MSGVNKVILVARLGRDPEMKYLSDGTAVCNMSVATSENWKDKNTGEKQEKTEWHRLVAFRRLAEICGEYLKKGSLIYVEGKLQTRSYDKAGEKHYVTEVGISIMHILESKRDGTASKEFYGDSPPVRSGPGVDDDSDIPF